MDKQLIKNLNNRNWDRAKEKDFDNTFVYKVNGDDQTLYYWNSSNREGIKHQTALNRILNLIIDGEDSGTVNDGWNEIMFEVEPN